MEKHSLDSFVLSRRRDTYTDNSSSEHSRQGQLQQVGKQTKEKSQNSAKGGSSNGSQADGSKYKYMLFVWNGKSAGATVKAQTLTKGYALDEYLQHAKDTGLNVLFSGGVVKNKKL